MQPIIIGGGSILGSSSDGRTVTVSDPEGQPRATLCFTSAASLARFVSAAIVALHCAEDHEDFEPAAVSSVAFL